MPSPFTDAFLCRYYKGKWLNMSRSSIRTFVIKAKSQLEGVSKNTAQRHFVVGNESADLDSITCALVYAYFESSTSEARQADRIWTPVVNIPASDLSLRPELTALLKHADLKPSDLVTLDDIDAAPQDFTLVDHNSLTGPLAERYADGVTFNAVIDHHDDEGKMPREAEPRIIEKSGSCNSLVINHLRSTWDDLASSASGIGVANAQSSDGVIDDAVYTSTWYAQIAKLALGSILIDTTNMTDENKVTDHDRKAVKYLEAKINASPKISKSFDRQAFFEEISKAKSDLDGLSLADILRKDYKQWSEGSLTLGMTSVVKPLNYLQSKVDAFVPALLDFAQARKLDVFAIMTAYTDDNGEFARQLLVMAPEEGKAEDAAERFARDCAEELNLSDSEVQVRAKGREVEVAWLHVWDQKNVGASRKKVGPMLREAMR